MRRKLTLWYALICAVLLVPLLVYWVKFGITPSSDHQRWSEFGSAIGGIYTPILALATLLVLFAQLRVQRDLNEHQFEQTYLSQARSDIEFHLVRLQQRLDERSIKGLPFRDHLNQHFHPTSREAIASPRLREVAMELNRNRPEVLAAWMGIYPVLQGLLTSRHRQSFELTVGVTIQKMIALLSFETCVAMDNYHATLVEGRMQVPYQFSTLLTSAGDA